MNKKEQLYKKIEILELLMKNDKKSKSKLQQIKNQNPNIIDERLNTKVEINRIK